MSAFSVSDLLNPAPLSHPSSPRPMDTIMEDDPPTNMAGDMFAPELFHADSINDASSIFEQQGMIPLEQSSSPEFMRKDSVTADMFNTVDTSMDNAPIADDDASKKDRSTKQRDLEKLKDTKHSSKNEGQHTDRRYLCYICHKLFTRRRSVRDHLNKIHGEKTWEPQRSLEVVVEPHTGEPIESIEDIIARGPPPPPPKPEKSSKPKSDSKPAKDEPPDKEEDEADDKQQSAEPQQQTQTLDPIDQMLIDDGPDADPEPEPESEPTPLPLPIKQREEMAREASPAVPRLKKEDSQQSTSRPASVEPVVPAPVIGKKRPLPSKKGTAKVKSGTPAKRVKLSESERSTPARSPSVTPAQKPGSKLKKPFAVPSPSSRASSRQPSASPSPSVRSSASSNDDGEVFCICRKGDNHTWMIACDGDCDEWYHGKCIGIRERDGELIDKFICDKCKKEGLITTWKRMCRRQDCRKPARVKDNPPSKYCSVECGRMFFVDLIRRGDEDARSTKDGQYIVGQIQKDKKQKRIRRRRPTHPQTRDGADTPMLGGSRPHTPAYSEEEKSEYETDSSMDEEQLPNRGGALRASEVKALLQQCKTIDAWRDLGKKPQTPPREQDEKQPADLYYDDFEAKRLESLKQEQYVLAERQSSLLAREKMLELIKDRSATIAEDVKKGNPKWKEICGYDPRAAWSEEEFLHWYRNEGKDVLERGKIGPPADEVMTDDLDDEEEKAATMKGGVCIRNRCPKHGRQWQTQQIRELRFEQDLVKRKQDNLVKLGHEIRSRAQIRTLERQSGLV